MDEEVRRLLRQVAEDDSLPPSPVDDAELLEKCRRVPAPRSAAFAAVLTTLRRMVTARARREP